jgi:uncharacterized membrane protein
MKKTSPEQIRKLVVTGALGALAAFLGITRLGLFTIPGGVSITILHIPAIIGAILEGPLVGTGIGAIFGIFSLIQANMTASGFDTLFRNPVVSILPRVIFPVFAWIIWHYASRINKMFAVVLASLAGTLIHTVLVLGALVLTNGSGVLVGDAQGVSVWTVIGAIFVANGIPEAIGAAVICSIVVAARLGLESRRKKSRLSEE